MSDLAAIVADCQSALDPCLAGWVITSSWSDDIGAELGPRYAGALAVCLPIPERRIAHVIVATSCPKSELRTTLIHELAHTVLSPLTALLSDAGAVMIEEQIVEGLSLAFVRAEQKPADALALRRALARLPGRLGARLRARMSARASRARAGGSMDSEKIKAALAALKEGNGEAALALLEELLTAAVAGDAGPDSAPQMRDDADPNAPQMRDDGMGGGLDIPMRRGAKGRQATGASAIDRELGRARKAADAASKITIRARVAELRQQGIEIDTTAAVELEALADVDAAEERIRWLTRGRETAKPRARSGAQPGTSPRTEDGAPPVQVDEAALKSEGFTDQWIESYKGALRARPDAAKVMLDAGREQIKALRARTNGAVNGAGGKA